MSDTGTIDCTIHRSASLREAMQQIDRSGTRTVVVVDDEGGLVGTATDGDIRRGILDGGRLDATIATVVNEDPVVIGADWSDDEIHARIDGDKLRDRTNEYDSLLVPVVSTGGEVVDVTRISPEGVRAESQSTGTRNVDTVLVIGGAGYIGSVMSRELLDAGYDVRVLDSLLYGRAGIADLEDDERFTLIEGDMRSIDTVMRAIRGTDAVIHLGALVGDPASSIDAGRTLELNYHSARMAAEICKYHQINRFIFASTCSVYGRSATPDDMLTETDELNPVSLYAQTKIESERALFELSDENFSPTVLRMATIYGLSPRMRFDLVVNVLSAKAHHEGVVPIFGGSQYRPNVHVADAARAYIDCLEAPIDRISGEIFNVGSNEQNYRIEELGRIVASRFPGATVDLQRDKEDDRSYCVDFSKIREALGYEVERTVADGVDEMKAELEAGQFEDPGAPKYSNYKTLESNMSMLRRPSR